LIGPPGSLFDYAQTGGRVSSLDGTPVFLGCSDIDPHIPAARVRETDAALARLGARVTTRLYPGMGHTVNADELAAARAVIQALL
jgi:predicted esterase